MKSKRILRHLFFWSFFFFISLFNELYFSSSFSEHPDLESFLKGFWSQVLLYSIKALVVYYSIYSIIPGWSASSLSGKSFQAGSRSNLKYVLEFVLVLLIGAFFMRLIVQGIIWVYIFPGEERILTFNSLLGRYFYSLFDLMPITLLAVAIKLVQLRMSALKQETVLVREKTKTELQYLKAQTHPHFLFNTLNGIYALSRRNDAQTPAAILNLSKILRYMLYETSHKTNSLKEELQLIEDYIALQKLRFQQHLEVSFIKEIGNENAGISPLLLLPLVENAFKHSNGLDAKIDLHAREENDVLYFSVSNTIAEPSVDDSLDREGIGLSNLKRQLAILYKEYKLDTSGNENTFTANLVIRLNSYVYV